MEDEKKAETRDGDCPLGGDHEWGTDGQHQNRFCRKCLKPWSGEYVDPYPGE